MVRTAFLSLCGFAALAGAAEAATLPIRLGDYVRDGTPCRDAPFAALMRYDGESFSGPHESACATVLLRKPGPRTYVLRSTCRAAGDGTPSGSYTETQTVRVLSPTRIVFSHVTGTGVRDRAGYRACPAAGPT